MAGFSGGRHKSNENASRGGIDAEMLRTLGTLTEQPTPFWTLFANYTHSFATAAARRKFLRTVLDSKQIESVAESWR
jgi:hypothetical protein